MRARHLCLALALLGAASGAHAVERADLYFGRTPGEGSWQESLARRTADKFGWCVYRKAPAEAHAFARALAVDWAAERPPRLIEAVDACLARPGLRGYAVFLAHDQNFAIVRVVGRKQGLPVPN